MNRETADQITPLSIEEVRSENPEHVIQGTLYAYHHQECIGALEFTVCTGTIFIRLIFVKPDYRGRGVAHALAEALLRRYPGFLPRTPAWAFVDC